LNLLPNYSRPSGIMQFRQEVVEARAKKAVFKFNGVKLQGRLPFTGLGGGLPACYAPTGIYSIPR